MAKPVQPEPKFFLVDEVYQQGLRYYSENWFSDAPEGHLVGEKSANYLESHVAAERIHDHIPQVKLVFALREPAARAWSNFLWSTMNGFESDDFGSALKLEESREGNYPPELEYARPFAYFSRGLYARLLRPYFDLFSTDRILVLKYEEIEVEPRRVAQRLYTFLGLSPSASDVYDLGVINPSTGLSPPADAMADLRRRYQEPNEELYRLLGPRFGRWEDL